MINAHFALIEFCAGKDIPILMSFVFKSWIQLEQVAKNGFIF